MDAAVAAVRHPEASAASAAAMMVVLADVLAVVMAAEMKELKVTGTQSVTVGAEV